MTDQLLFTIDGKVVGARPGETIWQVAQREGIDIPHLCWLPEPGYRADGNCRACMVEVEGERTLAASCIRKPTPDMVVKTATDRAVKARRMVMELLLSDQPPREDSPDRISKFWHWAEAQGIDTSRFPAHGILRPDLSHPAMAVNLDACIDCGLCVRACREVQVNDVIGMAFRNIDSKPVFDFDDPMGLSTCVACGECVQACPTGALMPKSIVDPITQHGSREVDREVHSVCPYCGVGCQISYQIKDNKIAFVQGRNGYSNENRLCVKGRFGFDYVDNPQRLMKPLIRKPGLPKRLDVDPSNPLTHFREASWEEALEVAAKGLARVAKEHGNEFDRRLRLGEMLERRSLSVPEADPHALPQQQHRSLHSALPRLVRGGTDRGNRLRRRDRDLQRGRARRRHHDHRRQPDRESSRRCDFL